MSFARRSSSKNHRGGKRSAAAAGSRNKRARKPTATSTALDLSAGRYDDGDDDDVVSSSDDLDEETPSVNSEGDGDDAPENLEVKKVRLARDYLDAIARRDTDSDDSSGSGERESADDDDDDPVARQLQRRRLRREGAWQRSVADAVRRAVAARQDAIAARQQRGSLAPFQRETEAQLWIDAGNVRLRRGHDLTPTAVGLASTAHRAVSGSKDHSVILWDAATETKLAVLCPPWNKKQPRQPQQPRNGQPNSNQHNKRGSGSSDRSDRSAGQVGSVACSDDGRLAAVGRHDATVQIFDLRSREIAHTFTGHKGPVTGLAFAGQRRLFSASADRCLRHYDLKDRLYLETLYGHQSGVLAVDCHGTFPVSVGADRTARYWKLAHDTHCIYRGGAQLPAADAVAALREDWFATGHADGTVALWKTDRKRPVAVARPEEATASHPDGAAATGGAGVVSMACVRGGDVVATGSSDGCVRFWRADPADRTIAPLCRVPLRGFANGLALHRDATYCVAAVGQEHRGGRWERVPRAKNRIAFLSLLDRKGRSQQEPEERPPAAGEDDDHSDKASSATSSVSSEAEGEQGVDYDALD